MEALKDFLENMFRGVEETDEVLRAKAELLQMMEDKYEQLLADGKNENEAVGEVISEFGNFQEIADELGIGDAVKNAKSSEDSQNAAGAAAAGAAMGAAAGAGAAMGAATGAGAAMGTATGAGAAGQNYGNSNKKEKKRPRRWLNWTLEDIEKYLKFAKKHARFVAFGVAFCILAPYMNSVLEAVLEVGAPKIVVEAISNFAFFGCIAAAVAFFIMASGQTKRFGQVNKDAVSLNGGAAMEIQMAGDEWSGKRTAFIVAGVIFIVLGPAVSSIGDILPGFIGEIVDNTLLLFVAIGVGLLVYASSVSERFKELSKGIKRANETDRSTFDGEVYGSFQPESGAGANYGEGAGMAGTAQPGVKDWTFQKKKGMPTWLLILIIVLAFLTINTGLNIFRGLPLLTGIRYSGCGPVFGGKTVMVNDKKSIEVGEIGKINVNLSASELIIEPCDEANITVQCDGSFSDKPVIKADRKELSIGEKTGFRLFGLNVGDGAVTLKVPKNKMFSYNIDLSMGDVKVRGSGDMNAVQANMFDADLSAGKLSLRYLNAHQMDVDLSAGDLELDGVKCDGKADFDLSAGAAKIRTSDLYKVDADLSLGSFEYELPEPKQSIADQYALDLDVSLGNITFMDEKDGDEIKRSAVDDKGEERYFKVDASMGSITIR